MLDETLRDYGDGALMARRELRDYTTRLLDDGSGGIPMNDYPFLVDDRVAGELLEHVRDAIRALPVATRDEQLLAGEGYDDRDLAAAGTLGCSIERGDRVCIRFVFCWY